MPELPDLTVYLESLAARIANRRLLRVRLLNPFLLRTALPPIASVEGKTVVGLGRLGKRIVISLEGDLHLVLHLMVAGRLRWEAKTPKRITLAHFEFDSGTLESQRYELHRDLSSWIASLGFTVRDNGDGKEDFGVLLTFTLKDLPGVRLPLSIDPEGAAGGSSGKSK